MTGELIPRAELSGRQKQAMFNLLRTWFDGVSRGGFDADLADKNWAILLRDGAGRIVGFTTLLLHRCSHEGERLTVVFSGDTVVDPSRWGTSALPRTWIDSVKRLHRDHGDGRLIWLLITSGFRTYRFLPVFWREFHPCHDRPFPESLRRLRDRLARERYGTEYDSAAGVVRFRRPQTLRSMLEGIPAAKMNDPHIEFFVRANPDHLLGDELVCITELTDSNLTAAGRRMVRAGARRRAPCVSP